MLISTRISLARWLHALARRVGPRRARWETVMDQRVAGVYRFRAQDFDFADAPITFPIHDFTCVDSLPYVNLESPGSDLL